MSNLKSDISTAVDNKSIYHNEIYWTSEPLETINIPSGSIQVNNLNTAKPVVSKKDFESFENNLTYDAYLALSKKRKEIEEEELKIKKGTSPKVFVYSNKTSEKPAAKSRKVVRNIHSEDFKPFPYMSVPETKIKKVSKEESEIVFNKDEELIINIEELADELAVENQKNKDDNKEYVELLKKYKNIILKHERAKKE